MDDTVDKHPANPRDIAFSECNVQEDVFNTELVTKALMKADIALARKLLIRVPTGIH
jgi:hypothetical protein